MDKQYRGSCYGCKSNSQEKYQHEHPGGCLHTWEINGTSQAANAPVQWASRDMLNATAHHHVASMAAWIDELERTPYCPILVGTGTAQLQGETKETFTLFLPDIFPNDYQTFWMVYSVKSHVQDTPEAIPAWASFSRAKGPKVMYVGNFIKLRPEEKEAFMPKDL